MSWLVSPGRQGFQVSYPSGIMLLYLFLVLLIMALAARLWVLQDLASLALNCRLCIIPGVIHADLPFLAALGWIFLTAAAGMRSWRQIPLKLLAVVGLMIYLADIFVMSQFVMRLTIEDVRVYLGQPGIVWRHLAMFSWSTHLLGTTVLVTLLVFVLKPNHIPCRVRHYCLWSILLLVLVLGGRFMITTPGSVHDWALRNVLAVNLPTGVTTTYSRDVSANLLYEHPENGETGQCLTGRGKRDHIVLLLLESWSTYHSAYWSGLNDWTPRLDEIARRAISFHRFHSGGANTNDALAALFTGRDITLPFTSPFQVQPFENAWATSDTLPFMLAREGYHTAFLTSGNLAFTRKGEWLNHIGFAYVEGHDYPGYQGLRRGHFDSVPDEALYARALDYISEQIRLKNPTFTVIENVSTHHPFMHPHTLERSEEAVFRYLDETVADFIDALWESAFFDNGVLLVISDHRAMTMTSSEEFQLFGHAAASLVPAFVLMADGRPMEVDLPFHQADLIPSLRSHLSASCFSASHVRDMFYPEASEGRCVLHARGDRRDHVDVFCPEGSGTVRVAGDRSRFVAEDNLDLERRRAVLDEIARIRIQAAVN